jgi:hypothetical protein
VPVLSFVEPSTSVCVHGSAAEGSSLGAIVTLNPKPASISILQEAFSIPWEVDVSASPEGSDADAGVEASKDSPVTETTTTKASPAWVLWSESCLYSGGVKGETLIF